MEFTDPRTDQSIRIRADNVVVGADGCRLIESMFSSITDLSAPSTNLAVRIHPTKARAFALVVTGQGGTVLPSALNARPFDTAPDATVPFVPEVELYVNQPGGDLLSRPFSEFLERSNALLDTGTNDEVRSTVTLPGFDPGAEPIVREMSDGSLLLIFAALPPFVVERDPGKGRRFDMDGFGEELGKAVGRKVAWDDREVFVVRKPRADTIDRLRAFLAGYWEKGSKRK